VSAESAISLDAVTKRFGTFEAVRDASFPIADGEFFTMLGPSGCGKTTTLRMIAGFEQPTSGRIRLRDVDVTDVAPNRRNVNMVFQHYALFPHMTVYDNVAFGLKLKKVPRTEEKIRVGEILEIVALGGMERRKPAQLSGGQQQRVALARALVNNPAALLLDEPLGALDVKLRRALQSELKRVQHETGTTFVYVTHDQEEALAMSDRIAVMNEGVVDQIGTPREIYETPATPFVADFVGSLNALDVEVAEVVGDHCVARFEAGRVVAASGAGRAPGSALRVAVRPERVRVEPREAATAPEGGSWLPGTVAEVVYLGMLTQYHVTTAAGRVTSHRMNDEAAPRVEVGSLVVVSWAADDTSVLSSAAEIGTPVGTTP
jgi:spermidine/putrescine transport system ATP-binding protein